mmetsp:Transcript_4729/g.11261  ORF Transcript_4729/g.11261 Transcript_4729/m.11261 type:complete len:250 (-) Transcript_4729:158-907(-)
MPISLNPLHSSSSVSEPDPSLSINLKAFTAVLIFSTICLLSSDIFFIVLGLGSLRSLKLPINPLIAFPVGLRLDMDSAEASGDTVADPMDASSHLTTLGLLTSLPLPLCRGATPAIGCESCDSGDWDGLVVAAGGWGLDQRGSCSFSRGMTGSYETALRASCARREAERGRSGPQCLVILPLMPHATLMWTCCCCCSGTGEALNQEAPARPGRGIERMARLLLNSAPPLRVVMAPMCALERIGRAGGRA